MDFSSVAKLVGKFAPLLGTVLGGPAGTAIGGAVAMVANKFGVDPEEAKKDPGALLSAIQADPEAGLKLVELQNKHEETLEKMALERDQMYLKDVQDARSREVKLREAGDKNASMYILAWVNVSGFFIVLGIMIFMASKIPATGMAATALPILLGALISSYRDINNYFFGSSKSSSDKTKLLGLAGK